MELKDMGRMVKGRREKKGKIRRLIVVRKIDIVLLPRDEVGDGCRVRFWEDMWCDSYCLRVEFPRLFSLLKEKKGALRLFADLKAISGEWNLSFRRELLEWERADLLILVSVISSSPLISLEIIDYPKWTATSSGLFSVASMYKLCSSGVGNHQSANRMLWNKVLPPKVQFFGWLAWKHKVKTSVFLQTIGVLSGGTSTLCCFYKHDEVSVLHVLLHCHFVWKWWEGGKFKKKGKVIWRCVPLVTLWSLWKLRNDCVFNNAEANVKILSELVKYRVALWLRTVYWEWQYPICDFVYNLN
ncbi:uncharacterized protein LOC114297126 [Camellia sinensis]|uniref:uncharacterized protein LOC114297126 n=1 Tax=Camellia sinensis TaxID=4442 RepID=UPI0010366586|nr:uncharacterized protein LOC114297126 [Camellia sinensis]